MSINGSVAFGFTFNDVRTVGFGQSGNLAVNSSNSVQAAYSNGAGILQVGTVYGVEGVFSGTTASFDFATGLTDLYGTAIALLRFKAILIFNPSTANNIVVGNAGTHPLNTWLSATGTITLPPGAATCSFTPDATGWAVSSGANDTLLLTGTSGQPYWLGFAGSAT